MPRVEIITELTVKQLLKAVAQLEAEQLALFERGFAKLRQQRGRTASDTGWSRSRPLAEELASIAASHRMPQESRRRLSELLDENKEGQLSADQEQELDTFIEDIDRRTLEVSQAFIQAHRQATGESKHD